MESLRVETLCVVETAEAERIGREAGLNDTGLEELIVK